MLDRLRYRLRALFRPGALEREMQDEMRVHLERRIEALVGGGMTPAAARLAARREFGNVGLHQEAGRDARGTQWLDALLGDIRFAVRHFARHRLATATIVAVLSLGIAVHAVELTLVRIATVKPPPGISSSEPLARVRGKYRVANRPEWYGRRMAYPEVRQMAALNGVFSSLAVSTSARVVIGSDDDERVVTAQFVNDDYFRTLGIEVSRGPGLPRSGSGAAGGELIAVVSETTWERALGRPDTVGQTLAVNGRQVRVAGVAPPRFARATGDNDNPGLTIWMPLGSRPLILAASGATPFALASPDSALFEVVGRLRDGVTADSASKLVRRASADATSAITQPTAADAPRVLYADAPRVLYDADAVYLRGFTDVRSGRLVTVIAWGIFSTLVLVVVCTNVSGLIAASAATRGHEIAVRLSLGASRGRIVRQLLTESCILALAGSAAGVFIYWAAFRLGRTIPEAQYYAPDFGTLALTLASAFGVAVLFGLTPALHAARGDVRGALSASGLAVTGPSRLQRTLVTAQITLTQPLLVMMASLVAMILMSPRRELPEVVQQQVVKFSLDHAALAGGPEARVAALERMVTHVRETPGVVSVLPDADNQGEVKFAMPGASRQVAAAYHVVRPGFFELLGVPLLGGNDRIVADSTRTVVIGADIAQSLFGDANPVGRYLDGTAQSGDRRRYLITGVYDSRLIGNPDQPVVYRIVRNWWPQRYLVRTSRPAADLMIPIRRAIRAELPTIPIESWTTMVDQQAADTRGARGIFFGIIGTVTVVLLISCIGLYGVVSLAVVQRQREIGIRMALGARAREVVSLFYRSGMKLTAMGLVFGLPISLAGGQILASLEAIGLHQPPNMLLVGAGVGGVMLVVASLATVFPATRAATVDPVSVLRSE